MDASCLSLVLTLALSGSQLVSSQQYDYEANGPSTWPATFPTCNGSRQSPIDIAPLRTEKQALPPLVFKGHWTSGVQATLTNNGHSAEATVPGWDSPPTLTGGPLNGTYVFQNLHFHWGADPSEGSEHTIGGRSFSMEAHVVHYNQAYGNFTNAVSRPDGIAVVAFFLQAQSLFPNLRLRELVAAVEQVDAPDSTTTLPLNSATGWFHDLALASGYWTYFGSLTTPLCQESVIWIVYSRTTFVSDDQVDAFRALITPAGTPLESNFRPAQPLNNRSVNMSFTADLVGVLHHLAEGYQRR